jgi:hypothetical protein
LVGAWAVPEPGNGYGRFVVRPNQAGDRGPRNRFARRQIVRRAHASFSASGTRWSWSPSLGAGGRSPYREDMAGGDRGRESGDSSVPPDRVLPVGLGSTPHPTGGPRMSCPGPPPSCRCLLRAPKRHSKFGLYAEICILLQAQNIGKTVCLIPWTSQPLD